MTPVLHTAGIISVKSFVLINNIRKMVKCELGDAITKKDGFRFVISNSRKCYKCNQYHFYAGYFEMGSSSP